MGLTDKRAPSLRWWLLVFVVDAGALALLGCYPWEPSTLRPFVALALLPAILMTVWAIATAVVFAGAARDGQRQANRGRGEVQLAETFAAHYAERARRSRHASLAKGGRR